MSWESWKPWWAAHGSGHSAASHWGGQFLGTNPVRGWLGLSGGARQTGIPTDAEMRVGKMPRIPASEKTDCFRTWSSWGQVVGVGSQQRLRRGLPLFPCGNCPGNSDQGAHWPHLAKSSREAFSQSGRPRTIQTAPFVDGREAVIFSRRGAKLRRSVWPRASQIPRSHQGCRRLSGREMKATDNGTDRELLFPPSFRGRRGNLLEATNEPQGRRRCTVELKFSPPRMRRD